MKLVKLIEKKVENFKVEAQNIKRKKIKFNLKLGRNIALLKIK